MPSISFLIAAAFSSEVFSPFIISQSGSRCGGLSQCCPINLSGPRQASAIFVMLNPEVFVASKASSGTISDISFQKVFLISRSSTIFSTTKKQSLKQSLSRVKLMRSMAAPDSSAVTRPSFIIVSWLRLMRFFPLSIPASEFPYTIVSYPARA